MTSTQLPPAGGRGARIASAQSPIPSLPGVGESTVERRWRFARAWLASRLGSDFERSGS